MQSIESMGADRAATAPEDAAVLDGVDLRSLARRVPTPFHAYSAGAIRARIAELLDAFAAADLLVCYAVKANPNRAVLGLMAEAGLGADIVSAGELHRALLAGIPASRIVFSGVGKTGDEIDAALAAGVARFNVESRDELCLLEARAAHAGMVARASARINPDVDAGTHAKISTGKAENKFGVGIAEARQWFAGQSAWPHVRLDGLHMHIGSQILSLPPLRLALQRLAAFWRELMLAGHRVASIDVGGGLGVAYRPGQERRLSAASYAEAVRGTLAGFDGQLVLEPGRWLVAEAGVLVTRVVRVKPGVERDFLVLDAAMNDLLRPSLYDAWHRMTVLPGAKPGGHAQRGGAPPTRRYDVVGPVCETGDTFATGRELPACEGGDLVVVRDTGAYGASMASTYNSRPLAVEVLLDRGRYAVVRRRQTLDEMIAGEQAATDWEAP